LNQKINNELMNIYQLMYSHFGPRNWWPADTVFEVVIGALLTQFVSWKNVVTAVNNLKDENILNIEGICEVNDEKLEKLIRSTRFYKQKARKLKVFCRHVMDNYGGSLDKLFSKDMYELRKELLSLYGIGKETADSIILYAAEKPIFVVDAYTQRIYTRLGYFNEGISYDKMQKFFMDNLIHNVKLFNEYHALIVATGNSFCSNTKPRCSHCPVKTVCAKKV
jgi:endonuclease-3 related protein